MAGETITLVPKRKLSGFLGSPSSDDIANIVNHIATSVSIPGSPVGGETVGYLHVTEEMRIPVGTDKFR